MLTSIERSKSNNYQNIILSLNRLWPHNQSSPLNSHLNFLKILRWTVDSLGYSFGTLTKNLNSPHGHAVHLTLELENPLIHTKLLENLKLLGLPINIFIKTDILDHNIYDEQGSESVVKNIEILKNCLALGWEIGTMGHSIIDLTNLNHNQQLSTLTESTDSLAKAIGKPPKIFLYPLGAYDASTVSCLKQLDFVGGITSIEGVNQGHYGEAFHLKRLFSKSVTIDIITLIRQRLQSTQKTVVQSARQGAPTAKNLRRTHLNFWLTDI